MKPKVSKVTSDFAIGKNYLPLLRLLASLQPLIAATVQPELFKIVDIIG